MITENPHGWPGYMAPELLTNQLEKRYKKTIDIWSIGCILYELFHLKSMWYKPKSDGLKPPTIVVYLAIYQRVNQHNHEPIDTACPETISEMIVDCTKKCASERPTAEKLLDRTKLAIENLKKRSKPPKPVKKPGLARL